MTSRGRGWRPRQRREMAVAGERRRSWNNVGTVKVRKRVESLVGEKGGGRQEEGEVEG